MTSTPITTPPLSILDFESGAKKPHFGESFFTPERVSKFLQFLIRIFFFGNFCERAISLNKVEDANRGHLFLQLGIGSDYAEALLCILEFVFVIR